MIGAAALVLGATLGTAGSAGAEQIGTNPARGAYERVLPLTKKDPECRTRTPFATLRPGQYRLTLSARRKGARNAPATASYKFQVTQWAKYRWTDCIVKGADDSAAIHMASIDQEGGDRGVAPVLPTSRARHRIPKVSLGGRDDDKGAGMYAYGSTLERISGASAPAPRKEKRQDRRRRRERAPKQPAPTQPAAPSDGCGRLWRHGSGRDVRYCADWAPAGQLIPVLANRDVKAGRRGWIDPAGDDWYYCQNTGRPHRIGSYTNKWWAYTMADNGNWGWVPETYFVGGGPNQKAAGLKHC